MITMAKATKSIEVWREESERETRQMVAKQISWLMVPAQVIV